MYVCFLQIVSIRSVLNLMTHNICGLQKAFTLLMSAIIDGCVESREVRVFLAVYVTYAFDDV